MSEFSERMKERTLTFADAILGLVDRLPFKPSGKVIAEQLADSATSVGSNYRAACNARSRREFIAKLGLVVEEADESCFWLELIRRRKAIPIADVDPLLLESIEIRNVIAKSVGTARANARKGKQLPNDKKLSNDKKPRTYEKHISNN
jgi:four helix bundle protein